MTMARIQQVSGETLNVLVPYHLHKEKLMDRQTKKMVEDMLFKESGHRLTCSITVDETEKQEQKTMQDMALMLGGDVVS